MNLEYGPPRPWPGSSVRWGVVLTANVAGLRPHQGTYENQPSAKVSGMADGGFSLSLSLSLPSSSLPHSLNQ